VADDQSSSKGYITLKEAADRYELKYNSILKYVLAGRIKCTILELDQIPEEILSRLDAHTLANIQRHQSLRVTTIEEVEVYLRSRAKGKRNDLI